MIDSAFVTETITFRHFHFPPRTFIDFNQTEKRRKTTFLPHEFEASMSVLTIQVGQFGNQVGGELYR
jgi:hypothetical protein